MTMSNNDGFIDNAALPCALSIRRILRLSGRDLIKAAFVRFLHRLPDPEGESYYLDKLKRGFSGLSILLELRYSEEGMKVGEPIKCAILLRFVARLLEGRGLIGHCSRYLASLWSLSVTRKNLSDAIIHLHEMDEAIICERKEREALFTRPNLPFSQLIPSEPMLKRAEKRVGSPAPTEPSAREAMFYTYFSEMWDDSYEKIQRLHHESYLPYLRKSPKKLYACKSINIKKWLIYS
jgi:hypothetical protein